MPDQRDRDANQNNRPERTKTSRLVRQILTGCVGIIAVAILWQAFLYIGLVSRAAEWQFRFTWFYYPTFSYVAIALLLSAPFILLLYLLFRRRRKGQSPEADEKAEDRNGRAQGALPSGWFQRGLMFLARLLLIMAAVAAIMPLFLPKGDGPALALDMKRLPAIYEPREGRVSIKGGSVDLRKTAHYYHQLLLFRSSVYYAPLRRSADDRSPVRYFVEVKFPENDRSKPHIISDGILRRNALPGEIIYLYRYAGINTSIPHFVVTSSVDEIRWEYFSYAIELLASALILMLAVSLDRHYKKKWQSEENPQAQP